jgi:replicative DNA helicase
MLKKLLEERDELTKKIRALKKQAVHDDIASDIAIYDTLKDMSEKYDMGDILGLQASAQGIIDRLNIRKYIGDELDPVQRIKQTSKDLPPVLLPATMGKAINVYRGKAVIIGAASGAGKSTYMVNLVYHRAIEGDTSVIFSLEMTAPELWAKLFQVHAKVRYKTDTSFGQIMKAAREYQNGDERAKVFFDFVHQFKDRIKIYEMQNMSIDHISSIYEYNRDKLGKMPDWVFIDYFQLIEPAEHLKRYTIREQQIYNARVLANKAKATTSVWAVVSQLNDDGRTAESRELEKAAGLIIVLNRDKDKDSGDYIPEVTINVTKNRFGPTSKFTTVFDGHTGVIGHV